MYNLTLAELDAFIEEVSTKTSTHVSSVKSFLAKDVENGLFDKLYNFIESNNLVFNFASYQFAARQYFYNTGD